MRGRPHVGTAVVDAARGTTEQTNKGGDSMKR